MLATIGTTSAPAAPFSIDVSKGSVDGSVSSQWMSRPSDQRFGSLTELHAKKKHDFDTSWASTFLTKDVEFLAPEIRTQADMRKLSIGLNKVRVAGSDTVRSMEVDPTHWAFSQLCRIGKAPAGYLRELPSQMVCDQLSWRLRYAREMDELGLYGNDADLKAATSPTYGRIPDHEIVEAVMGIAGDGLGNDNRFHWKTPGKIDWSNGTYDPENIGPDSDHTFYGSDRDMFIFLVDDRRPIVVGKTRDGKDDHMFRGFYIQNSEVGSRSLKLASFYLRGVCMNRNLWGCEGLQEIKITHTALAPTRWLEQCVPALEAFSRSSEQGLKDAVAAAKAKKLVDKEEDGLNFLKGGGLKFNAKQARAILDIHEHEEGFAPTTAWDFGQAITAFARSAPNTDARLDIELKAKTVFESAAKVSAMDLAFGETEDA